MTDADNSRRFAEWWVNRTPAELALHALAFDYEEKYFADLRLQSPSIRKRLLRYEVQAADGSWSETEPEPDLSIEYWIFKFRKLRDCDGLCDPKRRTVYIKSGLDDVEYPAALLHELIHVYESQLSGPHREWLLLDLHKRLSKRIALARLTRYIDASTHTFVHHFQHGVLFLLKSLDLDLRFGWPLGTVFGYGRVECLNPPKRKQ